MRHAASELNPKSGHTIDPAPKVVNRHFEGGRAIETLSGLFGGTGGRALYNCAGSAKIRPITGGSLTTFVFF